MKKILLSFLLLGLSSFISSSPILAICSVSFPSGNQVKPGDTLPINISNIEPYTFGMDQNWYYTQTKDSANNSVGSCLDNHFVSVDGKERFNWNINITAPSTAGTFTFQIYSDRGCMGVGGTFKCSNTFTVDAAAAPLTGPCAGIKRADALLSCEQCVGSKPPPVPDPMNGEKGVWTALGCVNTKPELFVGQLLGWVMGIGGGIAFLLIVFGGFKVLTSGGDPEQLNDGKEIIVSALTGLLLIIFSVILLRIIGKDILQIPGFSK